MYDFPYQICGSEQVTRLACETRFRSLLVRRSKLVSFSYVRYILSEYSSLVLKDDFIEAIHSGFYFHLPCVNNINSLLSKAFVYSFIWLRLSTKILLPIWTSIFLVILRLLFVHGWTPAWASVAHFLELIESWRLHGIVFRWFEPSLTLGIKAFKTFPYKTLFTAFWDFLEGLV